ncbi:MAG: hypothetical protein ACYDC1_24155 [Limisphaerales bacterium]
MESSDIITMQDLAGRLRMSRHAVGQLVKAGQIPHWKANRRVIRFHWPTVHKALFATINPTPPPVNQP